MDYKELIEQLRNIVEYKTRGLSRPQLMNYLDDAATAIETMMAEREAAEWISGENPPKYEYNTKESKDVLVLLGGKWIRCGKYIDGHWYYYVGVHMREIAWNPYKVTCWKQISTHPDRERTER